MRVVVPFSSSIHFGLSRYFERTSEEKLHDTQQSLQHVSFGVGIAPILQSPLVNCEECGLAAWPGAFPLDANTTKVPARD